MSTQEGTTGLALPKGMKNAGRYRQSWPGAKEVVWSISAIHIGLKRNVMAVSSSKR